MYRTGPVGEPKKKLSMKGKHRRSDSVNSESKLMTFDEIEDTIKLHWYNIHRNERFDAYNARRDLDWT